MTSIVLELQEGALNKDTPLTDLLRKALFVATKLEVSDFKDFINLELNGYQGVSNIPEYRKVYCVIKAFNPYRGLIPVYIDNIEIAEKICKRNVVQPISEIEELAGESIKISMHPVEQSSLQDFFKTDLEIRLSPPSTAVNKICDRVRTIILEWALELERQGIKGDDLSFTRKEKDKASDSPHVHIENFQGILGNTYGSNITQNFQDIKPHDLNSLVDFLSKNNVESNDINELKIAIKDDGDSIQDSKKFGKNVNSWIASMTKKALEGIWSAGINIGVNILVKAISRHYGLDQVV